MPVSLRCPHCSTVMQAADTSVGQKVLCPKCRRVLLVPAPARPAPIPAPVARPSAAAPPARPAIPPAPAARPPVPVAPVARQVMLPPTTPLPPAPPSHSDRVAASRRPADAAPLPPPAPARRSSAALQGPLPWIIAGGVAVVVLLGVTVLWAASALLSSKPAATQPDSSQASAPKDSPETPRAGDEQGPETTKEISAPPDTDGDRVEPETPAPPPPPANDPSAGHIPIFAVRLASLQRLRGDLRLLLAIVGGEKELDGMVLQLGKAISMEGALAVDTAKPCGAYVRLNDRGELAGIFVVLPVRSETAFRRLLRDMGLEEGPPRGELTGFRLLPQGLLAKIVPPAVKLEEIYLRLAGGHAHLCVAGDPHLLVGEQLVSADTLFRNGRDRLLSATVRLDQLPRPLLEQLAANLDRSRQQMTPPGVGPEAEKMAQLSLMQMETAVKEAHSLTLEVDVDQKGDRLSADLYLRARKGSGLATTLAEVGGSTSLFGELVRQDAAFAALVHVSLPGSLRPLLPGLAENLVRSLLPDITEEERRALGDVFVAGELDGAVVLRGGKVGQPATAVAGIKVPNGAALDRLFRNRVTPLKDRDMRSLFELDAETIAGVKAHRFRAQAVLSPAQRRDFGDNPWYFAFRSDALFWAAGADGKEALARALTLRPVTAPLTLLKMNLYQIDQASSRPLQNAPGSGQPLSAARPGRMRLELSGGEALHLHLGLDLAAFRYAAANLDALPVRAKTEPR